MRSYALVVCLLLGAYCQAQDGPGGVGTAADNVLWLSADQGTYTNLAGTTPATAGQNVAFWADRSGNNNHATHNTSGERPDLQTSVVNGLPVLRFSAANADRLLSSGMATANAASVWVVARWSSLPSQNPGLIQASPSGLPFSTTTDDKVIGVWVNSGNERLWGRGVQANNTQVNLPQNFETSANTFYAFLTHFDGASTIRQYVNNVQVGTAAYNGTLRSWAEFGIGRQGNESWNGDIAEVIAFNTAVNAAQRIIIDNYLAAKYNLSLSGNDLYTMDTPANGNFDFDVAGIGRVDASNVHSNARGSGIVQVSNPSDLGNNEFFMWGHNNQALQMSVTSGLPAGVNYRMARQWRVSETGNVGTIDLLFDIDGIADFAGLDPCNLALGLRLLIDTDNDGNYNDQTPIAGATHIGNNVFRFVNLNTLRNGMRFTLALADLMNDGPGGVGTIDGRSGLKLWFRTDYGVNTSGSLVDSWENAAGIAELDLSESGAQRPTLVSNTVNGFPEMSFDGNNRLRTGLNLTTSNFVTNEATTFVVARADNTTQTSAVYLTDPLTTNRFSSHIPWNGQVIYDIGQCCGTSARLAVSGLTGLTDYSLWLYEANNSGRQLFRNGTQVASQTSTSTYNSHATQRFTIGGNTTGADGFQGDVTEVIIFNSRLNSAQRIIVQNYLAAKYGLTLSSSFDYYKRDDPGSGNFDFDVAGIGRFNPAHMHTDARGTGMVRIFNPTGLGNNNEYLMWGHDNGQIEVVNTTDVPAGVQGRLERVWRVSEAGEVGAVDMQFDLAEFEPITAADLRLLIDVDGDGSFSDAGTLAISGATALACSNYLFTGVSALNDGVRFTIGSANLSQTPLPVEFKSFTGYVLAGNAHLTWVTTTEKNNRIFTIERSTDGKHFMAVGEVEGAGTTNEETSYNFVDRFPPYGVLYYRLRQTDWDGVYRFSDVIRLENDGQGTELIATPNPVGDGEVLNLRVRHYEKVDMRTVDLRIFDMMGREVPYNVVAADDTGISINLPGLRGGIFLVKAYSTQFRGGLLTRVLVK